MDKNKYISVITQQPVIAKFCESVIDQKEFPDNHLSLENQVRLQQWRVRQSIKRNRNNYIIPLPIWRML